MTITKAFCLFERSVAISFFGLLQEALKPALFIDFSYEDRKFRRPNKPVNG